MAKFLIPISIVLPALVLWCVAVVLILRLFGIRLWFGVHGLGETSAVVRWPARKYILLAGVLMWGGGLNLALTLDGYISWRLWPGEYPPLRLQDFAFRSVVCSIIGGVLAAFLRRRFHNPNISR